MSKLSPPLSSSKLLLPLSYGAKLQHLIPVLFLIEHVVTVGFELFVCLFVFTGTFPFETGLCGEVSACSVSLQHILFTWSPGMGRFKTNQVHLCQFFCE